MSKNIKKYAQPGMDKKAGVEHMVKRTKIVATVGPACESFDMLVNLVKAGVNVFRLNFSHGTHENKAEIIEKIRKINKELPYNIAILADLQGPKLRVGEIENNALEINPGDMLTFTNTKCVGTREKIYVSYPNLHNDVVPGNIIMIDDGKLEVKVIRILPNNDVKVEVVMGGILSSKKGLNLPDTKISLPALTEKDLADLDFILTQNVDWIALSFVREVKDIIGLKNILKERRSKAKVIAKIEKPEAVNNIRDIILESDGIIVATQMMESMIERVKPNRSEITDVANAVLEGADALMLSAETATGQHPTLVIETMSKIILEIEKTAYDYNRDDILTPQPHSPSFLSDALCYSACKLAADVKADGLIGMTQSGYTGFMLSSYRPKSLLFIFSKEKSLINQLSLSWGVRAIFYDEEESLDDIFFDQIGILREREFLKNGDVVVNTGSTPINLHIPTNILKITKIEI
jgi:pyruvate kinase